MSNHDHYTIRQDLLTRMNEKHEQWLADGRELYRLGGMKRIEWESDVYFTLLAQLAVIVAGTKLDVAQVKLKLECFVDQATRQLDAADQAKRQRDADS